MRHYVTHDGGNQTLYHVPRDRKVRASLIDSDGTVEIIDLRRHEDDADRVVLASAAAEQDTASQSLDAAAGVSQADPKRIPLGALTNILEGHHYLLTEDGLSELVYIERLDSSNTYAYAQRELRNDFTSAATLQGVELSVTFPTAEASDDDAIEDGGGPYGISWGYTIDGHDYAPLEDCFIRRHTTGTFCTPEDVKQAYPRLNGRIRDEKLDDACFAASRYARAELLIADVSPESLLNDEVLGMATTSRAVAYALMWLRANDADADDADIDHYFSEYKMLMRSLLNGRPPARTTHLREPGDDSPPGGTKQGLNEIFRPS